LKEGKKREKGGAEQTNRGRTLKVGKGKTQRISTKKKNKTFP